MYLYKRAIEITHSRHSHTVRVTATVASLTGYNIAGSNCCNLQRHWSLAWSCSLPVSLSLNDDGDDDDGARLDALRTSTSEEKWDGKEKRQSNWKIGKTLCKFYKGAMIATFQRSCRADPSRWCCCRSATGSVSLKLQSNYQSNRTRKWKVSELHWPWKWE